MMKITRTYPNGHVFEYTVLNVVIDAETEAAIVQTQERGSVIFTKADNQDLYDQAVALTQINP